MRQGVWAMGYIIPDSGYKGKIVRELNELIKE